MYKFNPYVYSVNWVKISQRIDFPGFDEEAQSQRKRQAIYTDQVMYRSKGKLSHTKTTSFTN